jgi:hypothetical protein
VQTKEKPRRRGAGRGFWVPSGGTLTGEGRPRQRLDYMDLTLRLPDKNQPFRTLRETRLAGPVTH